MGTMKILESERDRVKFFYALFSDIEPNQALLKANEKYHSNNDS